MFIGAGTVINVATVVVGTLVGLAAGHRFPARTRELVTQILGLVTLVIGGLSVADGMSAAFAAEVGSGARLLVVLGALLIGGLLGSALRLEERLDGAADWLRSKVAREADQATFIEAAVTATLIFCVGPLAIIGSISDGLGNGAEQLIVKAVMDGFAAIAFASTLGIGVMASVIPLLLYQGAITALGWWLGDFMPAAHIDALTATGGVILLGLGFRLSGIKQIQIGDLLPALIIAPLLTAGLGLLV
ncbi:MAG: DUF554 domain-containing protein [Actinobacteria bacterium]|nr:DUF554 domain-containing protein [Actinomycetota bacterium]